MIDASKYNRSIPVHCPTCGSSTFSSDDSVPDEDSKVMTCAACGREITKAELLAANAENVEAHLDEVKTQVLKDVEKQLKDAFKGFGRK